jgi:hypothetical protein
MFEVAGVVARLGFKVDDDGANRFERKIRGLREDTRKPVVAPLKAEIQGHDLDIYGRKLEELQAKTRRRDAFRAKLGADFDPKAFNAYERESRRVQRATDDNVRATGKLHTAFGNVYGRGGAIFAAAGGAYGLVTGLKAIVTAQGDAEASSKRVATAVDNAGLSYQRHSKHIDDVIQKQSRLAALDDEDLADSFGRIVGITKNVNEALRINAIAADVARGRQIELDAATKIVTRAYLGQVTGLRRIGVNVEPVTKAQDKLRESTKNATKEQVDAAKKADLVASRQKALATLQTQFGGQARAYGRSQQGALAGVQVAWENVLETLGKKLAPTITKVANHIAKFLIQMNDGTGAGGRFVEQLKDIGTWLKHAGDRLSDVGKFLHDHTGLIKAAAGAWLAYKSAIVIAATASKSSAVLAMLRGGAGAAGAGAAGAGVAGAAGAGAAGAGAAGAAPRLAPALRGVGGATAGFAAIKIGTDFIQGSAKVDTAVKVFEADFQRLKRAGDKAGLRKLADDIRNYAAANGDAFKDSGKFARQYADTVEHALDRTKDATGASRRDLADMRRDLRSNWKLMSGYTDVSLKDIRANVREQIGAVRDRLGTDTETGRKAVATNFRLAAQAIRQRMQEGGIDTKKGAGQIRNYLIDALKAMGLSGEQARAKVETGTIQTRRGPAAGAARGGRIGDDGRVHRDGGGWISGPGEVGVDSVPAMLAPGEAVLNRHQQAVVEGLLGNGFLDKLFATVNRPHYMARGGVARLARGGMVAAANRLDHAHFPYVWGGGHQGTPAPFGPMDCSGAVSYVLQQGGVSVPTMTSGQLMRAGKPGGGQVTVYANPEHTLMRIGGRFFGTSRTNPGGGAGWMPDPGAGYLSRFVQRHFEGGAGLAVPKIPRVLTRLPGGVGATVQRALDVARSGAQGVAQRAWASMGVGTGNDNNPGIGGMSKAALRNLWVQANGRLGNPNLMAAIALAESGGRASAANGPYHGLWQVGPGGSFNPLTNAREAGQKLRTQGLRAWEAYTNGSYRQFLNRGGRVVQKFADGGRVGPGRAPNMEQGSGTVQGFSLRSTSRRARHRVASYDETQHRVETLRKEYALLERRYNQTDEGDYLLEHEDGSVPNDQKALGRKLQPLAGMVFLARQISDALKRARRIAQSVVKSYTTIVGGLGRSLKHAKKKDRSGIQAQLKDARDSLAEWGGTVEDLRFDVDNAGLDLHDIGAEYRELVNTSGKAAPADTTTDTTGDTGPTADQTAIADQERQRADVATRRADIAEAALSAFTSSGDLGAGGANAYAAVTGQPGGPPASGYTAGPGGWGGAPAGGITIYQDINTLVPGTAEQYLAVGNAAVTGIGFQAMQSSPRISVGP